MRFIGNIEARTDAKGRVFLPAVFRKELQPVSDDGLVLRKDVFQPCLVLYPASVWNEQMDVLRSRLKVEYDSPGCRIDPYASAEMYNSFSLEKSRYIVGAEWKITRTHSVGLYYLYQNVNNDKDDDDTDEHVLGLSYRIKL